MNCVVSHLGWGLRPLSAKVHLEHEKYSVDLGKKRLQYTDQEMIRARNARNVVTLEEVMFVTIQRENILPSKITDYWLTNAHELLTTWMT
jgi:hypothetical protein